MYPDDEDSDSDGDKTELVEGMRIHAGDMGHVSDVHLHTE